MYVQCTMYLALCRRWRAYNRVILVQNAPSRTGNATTTTLTMTGDSVTTTTKQNGAKRKGEKKGSAPVQSVVTIASAFTGGNLRSKVGGGGSSSSSSSTAIDPVSTDTSRHHPLVDNIIVSDSLQAEEMAALLDLKTQPSTSKLASPDDDTIIPSIHVNVWKTFIFTSCSPLFFGFDPVVSQLGHSELSWERERGMFSKKFFRVISGVVFPPFRFLFGLPSAYKYDHI